MKKYYTQYLPVKGKPKDHDLVISSKGIHHYHDMVYGASKESIKKVKLFLVTKEIPRGQYGNRVYCNPAGWGSVYSFILSDTAHITFDAYHKHYKTSAYNFSNVDLKKGQTVFVIGAVSPKAAWIKEGDEFEEETMCPLSATFIEAKNA